MASDERTPLLAGSSRPASPSPRRPSELSATSIADRSSSTRRWPPQPILALSLVLLGLISASSLSLLSLGLLARSLAPSSDAGERAVVFRGPDAVRLLNASSTAAAADDQAGRWSGRVQIDGRLGLDGDVLLAVGPHGSSSGLWNGLRTAVGRFALDRLGAVDLELPDDIGLFAPAVLASTMIAGRKSGSIKVASIRPVGRSLFVPLTTAVGALSSSGGSKESDDWLTPITLTFDIALASAPSDLLALGQRAWETHSLALEVRTEGGSVGPASTTAPGAVGRWVKGWRKALESTDRAIKVDLPSLPPLEDVASLLSLHRYVLYRDDDSRLIVLANCSVPNPSFSDPDAQALHLAGLRWPGGLTWTAQVEVPDEPLGQVVGSMAVEPFAIELGREHFNFTIRGELYEQLPPAEEGMSQPLEAFLAAYLHEHPLALHLTPHVSPSATANSSDAERPLGLLPALLLELGPLTAPVPPADPPLKPLRSIEIEGMRLTEGRDRRMRASGRVRAIVDVPGFKGSQGVKLEVGYVRPDIFIFNGPVPPPDNATSSVVDPPPRGAFAHLNCEPLPAITTVEDPEQPNVLSVLAPFEDQLLDIVSEAELRAFVGKIILKGGALAGVQGSCDVSAHVEGLTPPVGQAGGIVIRGVEVDGGVWIGRRTGLAGLLDEAAAATPIEGGR